MAKIAIDLEEVQSSTGPPDWGVANVTVLAGGDDWSVKDIVCWRGPHDRPFQEQHE